VTRIQALALDLDDTLLLEREFVRSGFQAVGRYLKQKVDGDVDWFELLWNGFEAGVRGDAFNRVLASQGVEPTATLIEELVRLYREHEPEVVMPDDVVPSLEALGLPPERVGVITDGPPVMQRSKFAALGVERFVGHLIVTDDWGVEFRKPHPRAFETFEQLTGCMGAACAYVSDNPAKDFRSPHERGWTTIRICRPGGLHEAAEAAPGEVDHVVRTLATVVEIVREGEN
jgi:putative hydrolase of the HAD superfamily